MQVPDLRHGRTQWQAAPPRQVAVPLHGGTCLFRIAESHLGLSLLHGAVTPGCLFCMWGLTWEWQGCCQNLAWYTRSAGDVNDSLGKG
jgi:hypothetical protein